MSKIKLINIKSHFGWIEYKVYKYIKSRLENLSVWLFDCIGKCLKSGVPLLASDLEFQLFQFLN